MKQYVLILSIALSTATIATAQKNEGGKAQPPAAAKTNLMKAFPGATSVKWEKEDANYEAEFKLNGREMSADFDNNGTMLESETVIKTNELPAAAREYIKAHYKNAKIAEAAKITKASGDVNYEAEINKTDVMFDANGKFIKEVKATKD